MDFVAVEANDDLRQGWYAGGANPACRGPSSPTLRLISAHGDRNRSLIPAAENFAYMLKACPGAYINIGNAGAVGSCPVTLTTERPATAYRTGLHRLDCASRTGALGNLGKPEQL
jgi:hypothetical protein